MFDIAFTGEIVHDDDVTEHLCVMTLGGITEGFGVSFSLWSQAEYQSQWLEGARRLLEPDSRSAFIVNVADPPTAFVVQWWPAWRLDDLIVFQRQLLFVGAKEGEDLYNPHAARFSLEDPYASIPDRENGHTEECRKTEICRRPRIGSRLDYADGGLCTSEWWVYLQEMKDFIERRSGKCPAPLS